MPDWIPKESLDAFEEEITRVWNQQKEAAEEVVLDAQSYKELTARIEEQSKVLKFIKQTLSNAQDYGDELDSSDYIKIMKAIDGLTQ